MKSLILGDALIKALMEADILPEHCTGFILEAEVGDVVRLHYTTLGDGGLLEILPAAVRQAGVTHRSIRHYVEDPHTGKRVDVTTP